MTLRRPEVLRHEVGGEAAEMLGGGVRSVSAARRHAGAAFAFDVSMRLIRAWHGEQHGDPWASISRLMSST